MTAREVYEAVLVEINKENNPSFTIEEFNYALNKAVLAFVNEKYNFYASNQQLSDDLRVLLKPAKFNIQNSLSIKPPTPTFNPIRGYVMVDKITQTIIQVSQLTDVEIGSIIKFGTDTTEYEVTGMNGNAYPPTITVDVPVSVSAGTQLFIETPEVSSTSWRSELTGDRVIPVTLPASDYLHILSCRIQWRGTKVGITTPSYLKFPAKRLTFDQLNVIENNTYLRPAANRPYFQVFDNQMNSGVEKLTGDLKDYRAYQNRPTIEIHIGRSRVSMEPVLIEIDYLKLPELVVIDDVDIYTAGSDTSQSLELPDYLKNEIVRRISAYLLEKMRDPRIQTQPQLNTEIPTVPINMQQQIAQKQAQNQ